MARRAGAQSTRKLRAGEQRVTLEGSTHMIRLVTDSSSQISPALRQRYNVAVVPIAVSVNGKQYREGVDIDADSFYAFWADGVAPEVTTSQPSPGEFAALYQRLADEGAEAILSLHLGSAYSGTYNSARLGAEQVAIPVRLVDTATMSFGVSCCLWEAAEVLASGGDVDAAARAAERLAPHVGSVTILQALDFTRSQGRFIDQLPTGTDGISVLSMRGAEMATVGEGRSVNELAELMVGEMLAGGGPIRAAVCVADASAKPFYEALESRLSPEPQVVDLVRYRVGPSIGAFTGPGAAGGFWYPAGSPK